MFKYLTLTILLTSCGVEESKDEQYAHPEEPETKQIIVEEHRKTDKGQYAVAVDDTAELPECTVMNDQQLAYVKGSDEFYACTDSVWSAIESAKGSVGAKGEKGDKGDPGETVTGTQWVDPVTGKHWFFGVQQYYQSSLIIYPPCGGDYREPTEDEARAAVQHGLAVAFADLLGAPITAVWTSTTDMANSKRVALLPDGSRQLPPMVGDQYASVACISVD